MTGGGNAAVFKQWLADGRVRFNALFAQARQGQPDLDGAAFLGHVRDVLGPVAAACATACPDRVAGVLDELYVLSLDLFGRGLLGPAARHPLIGTGWRTALPAAAHLLGGAPRPLAVALSNALHNLATTSGTRPDVWLASMIELAPLCADAATWLAAGQVVAWRAGMAHYRREALALCRELPRQAVLVALGHPADLAEPPLAVLLDRLSADPWLAPDDAADRARPAPQLKLVARVGAFRGFGGEFLAPPAVGLAAGWFWVREGDRAWRLSADACGATLVRAEAPAAVAQGPASGSPFRLGRDGEVTAAGRQRSFPQLVQVSAWAADGQTLAATSPVSHVVYLIALV